MQPTVIRFDGAGLPPARVLDVRTRNGAATAALSNVRRSLFTQSLLRMMFLYPAFVW
jgi:hypothetical protein